MYWDRIVERRGDCSMHSLSGKGVLVLVFCFFGLLLTFGGFGNGGFEPLPFDQRDASAASSALSINGIWYLGWTKDAYSSPRIAVELMRLKTELAVNYVGLIIPLYQNSLHATDPHPDPNRTPSLATMARVIKEAHRIELGVILLPYLLVDSKRQFEGVTLGNWVGDLRPEDVGTWFENWREILRTYAVFAEEQAVEIMLLGWELETLLPYHEEWQRTIAALRDLYSGELSYLTNWWAERNEYAKVLSWAPWQSLDFIGVSAYFALTRNTDSTIGELEQAWYEDANGQNIVEDMEALSTQHDKPIVFWELGYQSKDGAAGAPWNFVLRAPPDEREQADALAAAFHVLGDRPWYAGHVIWGEQVGLRKTADSYSVLGKKAARIISSHPLGVEYGVEAVFHEAGDITVGMFANVRNTPVSGLSIAFDREVRIVNIIEIGGYFPTFGELTGTAFDFGEGELIPGGMVQLDWEPAQARPVLIRWID